MLYLVITNNGDCFQTVDKPEEKYKTEIAFGGWNAFRHDGTSVQPYSRLMYDMGSFFWETVDTLNQ